MTKKERYERFIAYFQEAMPEAQTELHYANPFQLLCAVMLSAQCTDKRVNMVTPALFAAYPTPPLMAKATKEEVGKLSQQQGGTSRTNGQDAGGKA